MIAIPHLWMVMVPITTPQICHPLPLLNSPSLMCAKAVLLPHHMAETWDIEALIQTVVPHHRMAMPTTRQILGATAPTHPIGQAGIVTT